MIEMNVEVVDETEKLAALIARMDAAPRIAIDTEFHNERSYTAQLMVIQLAFEDGVALVDPLALRDLMPFVEALARANVVGHALSSDLRIFAERYDRLPANAFDTQVAAAFCGYGLSISLLDLVRDLAGVTLRKSQTVSDWSARPLSAKQIDYLVDDVRYLFTLHDALLVELERRGRRAWAEEESRTLIEPDRYRNDPARLYLRVGGNARLNRRELGILSELAKTRERLARERNIPLKYVVADDVMIGLATLRPKAVEELGQLRRLDAGIRKQYGRALVESIAAGEAIPEDALPPRAPRPLPPQRESLVSTLGVMINAIAAQNDLPAALLLPRHSLERIARELPSSEDELAEMLDLTPWRRTLVVEPTWRMLSGETAIRIDGYANGNPRTVFRSNNGG